MSIAYLAKHFNNYESTYANLISSIIVHEWSGHGKDNYMSELNTHHKAYWDVINHPTWDQTTNQYKAFNLKNYQYYLKKETKQDLDPNTQKLYDQYIQYYRRPANYQGPK